LHKHPNEAISTGSIHDPELGLSSLLDAVPDKMLLRRVRKLDRGK
jgi:hypothetical protein